MKRLLLAALLSVTAFGANAHATTATFTIVINSPPSTAISCTQSATFVAPVAAGTVICPLVVSTASGATWSGVFSPLTGTNASLFAISGSNLVVGSTALQAGSYSVIVTANP